ncbi:respiratory nitrate reductase subunit gamma [Sediminicurvatus halobius]|uniref:nitrate reductase (quinone) n=1 Tax=Sediminicurvatus halobius TaxID=2182432 RepID=A0A2U2MWW9_9GAMM|nr:respiratory nitrate reductase subunit gamma [Spiribacter halobius]PWG61322.1 respiratory nitrate reductase subunit gamma [Spiribacter halobius]UEX79699.1 respiratory nitrate reductase subunit gamma [Spiribacter halobius]
MEFLNNLLFGYFPYVAGTVFLAGSLVRFDMSQYTWKTNTSQLLDSSRRFQIANNLFHAGMILLFFGHFFGMLTPPAVYHAIGISTSFKQVASMTAGGLFGILALVGGAFLLHRRLTNPRVRRTSSQGDVFILVLLYVQLILGMGTIFVSVDHLDGSTMLLLTGWAQKIVTFQPGAAEMIAGVHWIYKLHIFLGLVVFLVFPFTRLVHIWSVPYTYIARRYQIVRQRSA